VSRPREFDETEVLDRALAAFWLLGYDACSIEHLVKVTRVQRQSLYNRFGGKNGLFLAVLGRYREHSKKELDNLSRPEAGLAELRDYMERVLNIQTSRGCGACLLVRTSFGPQIREARVRKVVTTGAEEVRSAFMRLAERAVALGEMPVGTDPQQCAAYLYTVLNGLAALSATGAAQHVTMVLDRTFQSLTGAPHDRRAT
jgi:TetR/AcrR family transcriptional regulator, transcriptional repressor for nem operon